MQKSKPTPKKQEFTQHGLNFQFIPGTTSGEQINSLQEIKDAMSDILVQYVNGEDGSLADNTIKVITMLYMQADAVATQKMTKAA
ncbi:hypothetical protein [Flavitalea sp.]|nr:hypothetical protein [Flavitalea sp.]